MRKDNKLYARKGKVTSPSARVASPRGELTVGPKHSTLVVRGTMDFFQHRYYRTSKILMSAIGQWPEQTVRARRGSVAVIIFLVMTQHSAVVMACVKYYNDWVVVLDCALELGCTAFCLIKLVNFMLISKKTLKLINHIRADWLVWAGDREVNILHEYAEQGRNYVIVYTVGIYSLIAIYAAPPIVPKIIDVLLNNGSKPGKFLYSVYYYNLDAQKYYIYLMIYTYVSLTALLTIHVTNDVMMIVYVQHGCGVFAALGHKLQRIGKNEKSSGSGKIAYDSKEMNETFECMIRSCIVRHNDVIEYANLVITSYSWISFVIIIFRILFVNTMGLQAITGMNEPQDIVKVGTYALCGISYVYMESHLGQALMDHSISIRDHIQNSDWYVLSPKAQKLLLTMTTRCNVPCALTAGNLFTISVESFAVFLKASVSYLTFLRSL